MAIIGLRDTGDYVTDERPKNWREGLLRLYPNGKAPLTGLTSAMKNRAVDDPEFNWWDKSLPRRRLRITESSLSSSTTAISVAAATATEADGAKSVKAGDLLYSEESGEIMRVSSDPTTDTEITVTRGVSGTPATTYSAATGSGVNPYLLVVGSAYEEASSAPSGVNFDPTKRYNYTQIFRNTFEMSNTAQQTRLRTVEQVREARRETLELHGMDMERAFFFGVRQETTLNSKPIRYTDGFLNVLNTYASDNVVVAGATTDMNTFETYLKDAFEFGSDEKVGFCGRTAALAIQQIIRKNTTWNIESGIKEFGMNVMRIFTPFGTLVLKMHPLFAYNKGGTLGTSTFLGMDSWLAIMDMDQFTYVYLKGRDTKYEPKLQDNDLDGIQSGYISEAAIQIGLPATHYLIKGLRAGAADS